MRLTDARLPIGTRGQGTPQPDAPLISWPAARSGLSPAEPTMRPSETRAEQAAACGSWVAFLIRHCVAGMLAGWTAVGGLLWLNTTGLRDLVMASDLFPLPLLMLLAFFGITFGSLALGSAIMALGRSPALYS
jgi:hypothetical protein